MSCVLSGEANAGYHTAQYSCAFPEMIKDWREAWYEGTGKQTNSQFPFGFVQVFCCCWFGLVFVLCCHAIAI